MVPLALPFNFKLGNKCVSFYNLGMLFLTTSDKYIPYKTDVCVYYEFLCSVNYVQFCLEEEYNLFKTNIE